jgi:hypothetical protein
VACILVVARLAASRRLRLLLNLLSVVQPHASTSVECSPTAQPPVDLARAREYAEEQSRADLDVEVRPRGALALVAVPCYHELRPLMQRETDGQCRQPLMMRINGSVLQEMFIDSGEGQ